MIYNVIENYIECIIMKEKMKAKVHFTESMNNWMLEETVW